MGVMDAQEAILNVIQNTPGFEISADWQLTHLQENAYRLSSPAGAYFVKWVAKDDVYGQNEIQINQAILTQADLPAPRLLHVLNGEHGRVACWEWLEGTDLRAQPLRTRSRDLLPQAFASLARFHKEQLHSQAVVSPVTRQAFPTIGEMLQAELEVLCQAFDLAIRSRCAASFDLLAEHGYPTLIHGDMHPGNLRLTERGLLFVDWGFALPSLNLFDLDYVQSVDLDGEKEWWDITPAEAQAVLPAYFQDSGLSHGDIWAIHRSVMVWNQLRSHFNALSNGDETGARRCRQHLEQLLP